MDNITAKFTAICCSYIKIRLYGVYYAGSSHSSKDGWSFSFIDVHGLSPYWTQIKDERILDYDSSKTYESQDVAVLNRKLYRCALPVDDRTGMSYDYMTKIRSGSHLLQTLTIGQLVLFTQKVVPSFIIMHFLNVWSYIQRQPILKLTWKINHLNGYR